MIHKIRLSSIAIATAQLACAAAQGQGLPAGAGCQPGDGNSFLSASPQVTKNTEEQTMQLALRYAQEVQKTLNFTPTQAAGFVGNLIHESGLNSGIKQEDGSIGEAGMNGDIVNATGYGIAQWGEERKANLIRAAAQGGIPVSSQCANWSFLISELVANPAYANVVPSVQAQTDLVGAVCSFEKEFEAPSQPYSSGRIDYAKKIMHLMNASYTEGPVASSGDACDYYVSQHHEPRALPDLPDPGNPGLKPGDSFHCNETGTNLALQADGTLKDIGQAKSGRYLDYFPDWQKYHLASQPVPASSGPAITPASPSPVQSNAMPPGFQGVNSGIGSWFMANLQSDSTNGHSWCGYPYANSSNGFAPDISVMTEGTNAVYGASDYETSAKKYCGLEARVTNPATGITKLMYIIDAFDHKWVRSPGSIDIMADAWSALTNQSASDKQNVIQGVTWELTGNRSDKYCFACAGDK